VSHDAEAYGVYLHVPFCRQRCDYCAFVTYTNRDQDIDAYVDGVLRELDEQDRPATSVFFGGGTPSMLPAHVMERLIAAIAVHPGAEITMEVNPEDVTEDYLHAVHDAGITRVSVGIQSTAPHVLKSLGRIHRAEGARELAELIDGVGFTSWSMDLILGTVGEREEDVRETLATVLDHDAAPPHLSAYLLTPERATPLGKDPLRHPSEETLADRYLLLNQELERRNYGWYEISNFSRDGHECRHNQLYWAQGDYLGVGPGAHGHLRGRRSWRIANLDTWLERSARHEDTEAGCEIVEEASARFERAALMLRTRVGVPAAWLADADELSEFVSITGDRAILTPQGRLMADEIARRLEPTS
jgi:putative oxygen-independent coproporphyrinogen III oxidase